MAKQIDDRQLIDAVAELGGIQLVYLYGSQVSGDLGPMSDYDLAILVDRDADKWSVRAQFAHKLSRMMETDTVDVILLSQAPIELAYAVIAQGLVLYQRDELVRVEYEAGVMSRYGDYLPVLRAMRRDILRGDEYASRVYRYRTALGRTRRALGQAASTLRETSE